MVPPAATVPLEKESAYLYYRIEGTSTFAMVAAITAELPETAEKPAQAAQYWKSGWTRSP
jgi:hypothetical protein